MAITRTTSIKHDVTGLPISSGNLDNIDDKRMRINNLKQTNTSMYYKETPKTKSDEEIFWEIQEKSDKFVRSSGLKEEQELAKTLEENNLLLYCYPYNETSQDKRDVARMAFNAHVERPLERELSPLLRDLKNFKKERAQTTASDYDLSYSSVWNVFKQVPEFKNIEEKVKKGLSMYGVDPKDLPSLKLKDFSFIINEQFRGGKKDSAKMFEESYKAKHTKKFINENEEEFRTGMLTIKGVDPKYVEELIAGMKKGITDLSYQVGEGGKPKWEGQPVIDVHHIVNIKDSSSQEAEGKSFASINDYSNMCFIVRNPQHDAMHALENDMNGKCREDIFYNRELDKNFIYRIQPPEGVKCMFGFNSMIYDKEYIKNHDMSKETLIAKSSENINSYKNPSNRRWTDDGQKSKMDSLRKAEKNVRY